MFAKPPVVFPNVEAWAVAYLTASLGARVEDYADATVDIVPRADVARMVTVRDDGGPRGDVTRTAAVAVNAWADADADAADLVLLVVALLERAPGNGPIVGYVSTAGPTRVPEESGRPHWFATVDLTVRGSAL
jgi:hypothetical protein